MSALSQADVFLYKRYCACLGIRYAENIKIFDFNIVLFFFN